MGESHRVVTKDGYHLTLNHMRPSILLVHGLLDSCFEWIYNGPNHAKGDTGALAYTLADQGFDVWLANVRGNTYSLGHDKYTIEDKKYWDFSYDEMGKYDLPAFIDHILEQPDQRFGKVGVVGHSQGTILTFLALTENYGNVQEKIALFQAFAPVVYLQEQGSFVFTLLAKWLHLDYAFKYLPINAFSRSGFTNEVVMKTFCEVAPKACKAEFLAYVALVFGVPRWNNFNTTLLAEYQYNNPAGTSLKNLAHWAQQVRAKEFQAFDYGSREKNIEKYGAASADRDGQPPLYNIRNITRTKVSLYVGKKDDCAKPADVMRLISDLPKESLYDVQIYDQYEHLDFSLGLDANRLVYPNVLKLFHSVDYDEVTPTKVERETDESQSEQSIYV